MSVQEFDNFAFSRLRALVEVHRTRWGISPSLNVDEDGRSRPAVRLSLRGGHAHAAPIPVALCFECRLATSDLMKIAESIVGAGCPLRADYSSPCCVRAERTAAPGGQGVINVEIQLAEDGGPDGRRTFCDANCVSKITARLRALGARQVDS
jgi:hypothetical protein